MNDNANQESICAHLGDKKTQFLGAVVPPIFINTLHVFPTVEDMMSFSADKEGTYTYGRVSNPTVALAEEKIAALEHADDAAIFSSGMGALSAAMLSCLKAGDHVITLRNVYGVSRAFLSDYLCKFGIEVTYIRGLSVDEFREAIRPNTALIYLESPLSMIFTLQDLSSIAVFAKSHGIRTMIDNSWSSPIFQKPLDFGIDIVCHTVSKYLGGHSDIIAGVVCADKDTIRSIKRRERELIGSILGPAEAAMLVRSLRTLPIRMKQHCESGLAIASFLESHPRVKRVAHPGLPSHPQYELGKAQMSGYGGVFGIELDATPEQTRAFVNSLKIFQIGVSWGGFESLSICMYTKADDQTLEYFNVPRSWVRIAVGLERAEDLIEDLSQALDAI